MPCFKSDRHREAHAESVPAVDRDDREREIGHLLIREVAAHFLEKFVAHRISRELRHRIGPAQRRLFARRVKVVSLLPGAEQVEALAAFASRRRVAEMHIDAERAGFEERGPELYQLHEWLFETAL